MNELRKGIEEEAARAGDGFPKPDEPSPPDALADPYGMVSPAELHSPLPAEPVDSYFKMLASVLEPGTHANSQEVATVFEPEANREDAPPQKLSGVLEAEEGIEEEAARAGDGFPKPDEPSPPDALADPYGMVSPAELHSPLPAEPVDPYFKMLASVLEPGTHADSEEVATVFEPEANREDAPPQKLSGVLETEAGLVDGPQEEASVDRPDPPVDSREEVATVLEAEAGPKPVELGDGPTQKVPAVDSVKRRLVFDQDELDSVQARIAKLKQLGAFGKDSAVFGFAMVCQRLLNANRGSEAAHCSGKMPTSFDKWPSLMDTKTGSASRDLKSNGNARCRP